MKGEPMCMEEKRYDVDAVREWLDQYLETEKEIDDQIERLERLESRMRGISAQVLTGMPRSPSASTDRMADMVGLKEELNLSIKEAVSQQSLKRIQIESVLKRSCKSEEKSVIRLRYIDRTEWNDVLDIMFGGKPDFLEKEESYKRRMYRKHESAILNMARYFQESNTAIPAT